MINMEKSWSPLLKECKQKWEGINGQRNLLERLQKEQNAVFAFNESYLQINF